MPNENVIVLQSSDIGPRAYDVVNAQLIERPEAYKDESILARAEELYSERYE